MYIWEWKMPTKKLTTKQAWRKIAEKLSDPTYNFHGLCSEIWHLSTTRLIDYPTMYKMEETIHHHRRAHRPSYNKFSYVYPAGKEREARIFAALFFAEGA